ncbi:hypothetical protein ABH958_005692, partial [Bacillus sp. RC250]
QIIFIGGNDPQLLLDSLLEAQRQQPRRSNKKSPKGKYCVDGTQDKRSLGIINSRTGN